MKTKSLLTLTIFAASIASAGVIFSTGNIPQLDEAVLFHDSCLGCVDGPALTVKGHTQNSNILVDLHSEELLVAVDPGHNAVSTPDPPNTGFDDLTIAMEGGHTFTSIILQLTELSSVTNGTVTFTAHTNLGDFSTLSPLTLVHQGGGQNYFTITTDPGTVITQLDLFTNLFQHDISQIRIGGFAGEIVPEPATSGMIGAALIGLALFRRRRPR